MPTTTLAIPAAITASAHGPVRPVWLHGSRVHASVAPLVRSPAALSATTSAWGPPGGWVAPSKRSSPDWMTAPTHGLGAVVVRTPAASDKARSMSSLSDDATSRY